MARPDNDAILPSSVAGGLTVTDYRVTWFPAVLAVTLAGDSRPTQMVIRQAEWHVMEHGRRPRGDLEHEVLAILAAGAGPMTAAEVREVLDASLAYNTVLTVLGRLHDKGEVTREPVGRAYAYRAVTDRATVTAWRMQRLLDDGEDRAAVLARFHGTLSTEDAAILGALISNDTEGKT
jgi:predicted transcriptional regulator